MPRLLITSAHSPDAEKDVAEDITREALGRHPGHPLGMRIYGVMDFKRATYCFMVDHVIKQALLVDSKAEKTRNNGRLQVSQTSLPIRQVRQMQTVDVPGTLPVVMNVAGSLLLTTTMFVHYHYRDRVGGGRDLRHITVAALPNGRLADRYVPNATDTIWAVGPDAPTLGEDFRTRLNFGLLRAKAMWRVQHIGFAVDANGAMTVAGEWEQ